MIATRVQILSPYPERLARTVEAGGGIVTDVEPTWLVSYGHRDKIGRPVLEAYPGRVLNLHISMLPWNRGADPNLWSWIDDTPKGVTLHVCDESFDTGPILAQIELPLAEATETLATSYDALRGAAEALFGIAWPMIIAGRLKPRPQPAGVGTLHRLKDAAAMKAALPRGFDTPCNVARKLFT